VLLVALFVYNKWQERQALKRMDASMRQGVGDALLGETAPRRAPSRIEPRLDSGGGPAPSTPDAGPDSAEPTDLAAPPGAPHVDGWAEDPLLDFVLELRCSHAFDGVAALEARAQLDRLALPLPTHLAVWDPKAQHWTAPDRFGFYSELLASVQMATRRQVLSEIEASRFVSAVQQIALTIDADFDAPEMGRLVAQAAELDALCARFDVQITLTLEAQGGSMDGAVVDAAADIEPRLDARGCPARGRLAEQRVTDALPHRGVHALERLAFLPLVVDEQRHQQHRADQQQHDVEVVHRAARQPRR
jgi:hypothetical protein